MTAVQELTKRLQDLPEEEREALVTALLNEIDEHAWDRQIAADAAAVNHVGTADFCRCYRQLPVEIQPRPLLLKQGIDVPASVDDPHDVDPVRKREI